MADDGSSTNALTRSLVSIRDAVIGESDDSERSEERLEQRQDDGEPAQPDAEQSREDSASTETDDGESAQPDAEQSREDSASTETDDAARQKTEEYADIAQQCATGDLTVRMDPEGDDEAIDRLAAGFDELVSDLETTTSQLKAYVEEIESAGVGIEKSAETVRRTSDDMVDSMQNISTDAASQREQLETVSETLDGVAATLEKVDQEHPDAELESQVDLLEEKAKELRDLGLVNDGIQTETNIVSAAIEEQAAELGDVSSRADDLQRFANPLNAMLDRFVATSEHGSARSNTAGDGQEGTGD